jgi:hypothetical protein
MDGDDGISCIPEVIVEEEILIPVESNEEEPALEVDIDPESLSENYQIGYGFWYKFLFRLPSRVELESPRENWLGIAGLTEDYDYGASENPGDRKLAVFS